MSPQELPRILGTKIENTPFSLVQPDKSSNSTPQIWALYAQRQLAKHENTSILEQYWTTVWPATKGKCSSSTHTRPLGQEHSLSWLYINMLPTILQSKLMEQRYSIELEAYNMYRKWQHILLAQAPTPSWAAIQQRNVQPEHCQTPILRGKTVHKKERSFFKVRRQWKHNKVVLQGRRGSSHGFY